MLKIQVDEAAIKEMYEEAIDKKLEELNEEFVFWDSKELMRRTCLSWNTMQEHFFHDPKFPKAKIGSKWYFPAKEAEEYLVNWFKERRRQFNGEAI